MKTPLLLFISIVTVTCNVTNRSKTAENTTKVFVENDAQDNEPKDLSDKKVNGTKSEVVEVADDARVYLDDVLFALYDLEWSEDEKPCLKHIYRMLYSLQNFTLWAVWDWDSQSSEPQGLLFANRYQLGNFDQCLSAPWSDIHKELKTKYCISDIMLERTDKTTRKKVNPLNPYQSALDYIQYRPPHTRPLNEITWGACVPHTCGARTIERLLGIMLARSHLGTAGIRANISITEPCQMNDDHKEYDGLFYGFMTFISVLVLTSIICTFINSRESELDPDKKTTDFIKAFCIRENACDLMNMKKEGLEVFYGIKFLTICLITLDHQIGISNSGPISNGYTSDQVTMSIVGMLILHDDLFVDTFFLLSGFLSITYMAKLKRLPNPLFVIMKRYVRLVVALAVIVFYLCAVFPYTGSGPLWNRVIAGETETCLKNWWLNLLMVQNYIDTENICLVPSWYIPCDFHFFVVTILIFYLFKKAPALGLLTSSVVAVLSIILPGIITYTYGLPAIQLFTFEFITNPRGSPEFSSMYIKSHTRFAAYLVGVFSGYLYIKYSQSGNLNRIPKKWASLGTCIGLILMLVVLLSGSSFLWRSYHPLEGAVYAALNRPAWAAGVALLVLCCSLGHVPLVKAILSWYPFVPLSRLTYGLYLTHTIIITRNVFVTRNPQHNDYFEILNTTAGVIFCGCVASLFLWVFAEAPANKLLTLCLKSRIKKHKEDEDRHSRIGNSSSTTVERTPNGSGHLQDNLPTTLQFYSKM